jgi:hypothetical protein
VRFQPSIDDAVMTNKTRILLVVWSDVKLAVVNKNPKKDAKKKMPGQRCPKNGEQKARMKVDAQPSAGSC